MLFLSIVSLKEEGIGVVEDRELRSALGAYDGRVYERLMEMAKLSPFNKQEVMECHERHLGPLMREARAKL